MVLQCGNHISLLRFPHRLGDAPDPQGVHYAAMVSAVKSVSTDSHTPLEQLRVWVDVASIPQAEAPHKPISMIMCDGMAFCGTGEDIKPVGKITVTKMM